MTYGPRIMITDGKMPWWLRDSDVIEFENTPEGWLNDKASIFVWGMADKGTSCPVSIRLRADHPYYNKVDVNLGERLVANNAAIVKDLKLVSDEHAAEWLKEARVLDAELNPDLRTRDEKILDALKSHPLLAATIEGIMEQNAE